MKAPRAYRFYASFLNPIFKVQTDQSNFRGHRRRSYFFKTKKKVMREFSFLSATSKKNSNFLGKYLMPVFLLMAVALWQAGIAQPWSYDFGTGTSTSYTTISTAVTSPQSYLPSPQTNGGTARVRNANSAGAGFFYDNPGLAILGTGAEARIVPPTSSSASGSKFSIYDYSAGKEGYIKFSIVLGGAATSGQTFFAFGDGAWFSDNNQINATSLGISFAAIRWTWGSGTTITTNINSGSSLNWVSTGITNPTTTFVKGSKHDVEIYFNNTTTASKNYTRGGSQTVGQNKWDLWVDGVLIGDELVKAGLGNDLNIDSWAFHIESSSNTAVTYLDDLEYSNALPANAAPTATSVSISGTTTQGQTLTGNYTYNDADGDAQGTSTFKWYRADNAAGLNETAIGGATATTYLLTGADAGKYIRFSVVPVASTGTSPGTETFSARVGPITALTPLLSISGTLSHGSVCPGISTTPIQYTITNNGAVDAEGINLSNTNASEFAVTTALSSTTIPASGGTVTFSVTFTPGSAGAKSADITVTSTTSGSNSPVATLTGTGITPVTQTVTSSAATLVVNTTATLNGNVTALGVCPTTTEKGFVYSLTSNNNDPVVSGSGVTKTVVGSPATGAFTLGLTGLTPNSGYSYKAYVYNGNTYTYSSVQTFTTNSVATKLVFGTAPPATGSVGVNLTTFTVQAQRADNSVDPEYATAITVAKVSGPGAISGTAATSQANGIATFSGVQFDAVGTYTINASSGALTPTPTSGNIVVTFANATAIVWGSAGGSAWLTNTNWTGNSVPSSTQLARFDVNPTPGTSVNINGGVAPTGAVEITNNRSIALTIGNNSGSQSSGTFVLSGVVVNSTPNVIIRNNSSQLLTIQNTGSTGNGLNTMALGLGNTTNNNIYIDGTGGVTISSIISGGSDKNLTKAGTGSGVLTLSGVNTYSGTTTVTSGELNVIPSGNNALAGGFFFNGGKLSTTGIAATRTISYASINLLENSDLALGSNAHTLTFTTAGTFTSGKMLTVTGWAGASYGSGISGTGGKLVIGSVLNPTQLAQIRFYNGSHYFAAKQLVSGEIVPAATLVVTNPGDQTAGLGFNVTVTARDLDGTAVNLANATEITLTSNGTIGGNTTGTITGGTSAVTITGVTLTPGTNLTLTATATSGDQPYPGTSGTFNVVAPATPSLSVTGTQDFGSSCPGVAGSTIQYTITNSGLAVANGVSLSNTNAAEFAVTTALSTTTIAANGGTATFSVTFTPASAGSKLATIGVSSTSPGSNAPSIDLEGIGITPVSPSVSTAAATSVMLTTATLNGNVTTLAICPATTEKGFVYSETGVNADPLAGGGGVTKTAVAGLSTGSFNLPVSSLSSGTAYTFKAYLFDGSSYVYGNALTFTTTATAPTLTANNSPTSVDNNFTVSFPTSAAYATGINNGSIQAGATTLTSGVDYTVSGNNTITFSPSVGGSVILKTPGSFTITVNAAGYEPATVNQTLTAGAPAKLAITVQPTGPTANGGNLANAPVVTLQDQYGNTAVATSNTTIVAAVNSGAWTIGGSGSTTGITITTGNSTATFTVGTISASSATAVSATVKFTSSPVYTQVVSNAFNIPAPDFISLQTVNTAVTENFNTLASSGSSSTLPQGWYLLESGTGANTTYTAGTGSATAGDTYSFGAASNPERALGSLASGSVQSQYGAKIKNNTGAVITDLKIDYVGEQWRIGGAGTGVDLLSFEYSLNATSLSTGLWTAVTALDFHSLSTSGTAGASDGNTLNAAISATISSLNIPAGAIFWIRFSDENASGSDDGLAVDDLSIIPNPCTPGNWIGGSGNWSDAANWSCNTVPASGTAITISAGSPVLDVDFTVANSLVLSGSGGLTIAPNKTLTISGSANFGNRPVTVVSNSTGTGAIGSITGSLNGASNVTVERYIPTAKRAWRLLSLPVTGPTLNQAWAAAPADPTQNRVNGSTSGQPTNNGTLITGNLFTSGAVANAAGFDWWQTGASSSIRFYTNSGSTGTWDPANNTPDVKAPADKQGYLLFVRGDRTVTSGSGTTTLRPTGIVKTGDQLVPVSTAFSHIVVGNPYASPFNFETMRGHSGNASLVKDQFWIWDATYGTNGGYKLVIKNGSWNAIPSPYTAPPATPSVGNYQYIQSGEAFFVEPLSNGNLTISETDKETPANLPTIFDAPAGQGMLFTNLNQDNGSSQNLTDGVLAVFGQDFNKSTTDRFDIKKLLNLGENFSLIRNGSRLTMEALPFISGQDTLYFNMSSMTVRNYNLQFKAVNMQAGLTARLEDGFTGKSETIGTNDGDITTYAFSVTSAAGSAAADRFRIVFKADQTLPLTLNSARAYQQGSSAVQVDWKATNERNLRSYEVEKSLDGRSFTKASTVAAKNSSEASYSWLDGTAAKGLNYYRIKAISNDGTSSYSQVLLVNINNGKSLFSIYPNPAKAGKLSIQFSNMDRGQYELQLFNSVGQKILSRSIEHMGGSSSEELNLGSATAAGVYRVYLLGSNGISQLQTLVIQ